MADKPGNRRPAGEGNGSSPRGNPGQLAAIGHGTGPLLVLAGPGSGKTTVITRRIRCLIEEKGCDPSSILVITFTKAAAGEMKERFVRLTENKHYPVSFGTFHAVYYHILQCSGASRSGQIISESEKRELLKIILMRPDSPVNGEDEQIEEILTAISVHKNNGGSLSADAVGEVCGMSEDAFLKLYTSYTEEMERKGKIDFDDMVLKCHELFLRHPQILAAWQKKFRFILVDEFQDINTMQYEILRMLALPENNLFVVGDDDQSIYAFRGARPEIMCRFLRDYPDARKAELSVNYRSTPEIVALAGRLIAANRERLPKRITAAKPPGRPVRFLNFTDKKSENEALAKILAGSANEKRRTAVIFRTNQDILPLAEALTERHISFSMREKIQSPYRSGVAQDLLAYLSFAMEGGKRSDFYRIMNRPKRYISRRAVQRERVDFAELQSFYRDRAYMRDILRKFQMDVGRLGRMDLFAAVNYIRRGIGYDAFLKQTASETGKSFRELCGEADWFQNRMREHASLEELKEHIRDYERELERASAKRPEQAAVNLLTMHACKGLEFELVCIPDCNEGVIPHRKSMRGSQAEEERRMFYVAMTRAGEELILSWISGTEEEPGFPSRFLADLGL